MPSQLIVGERPVRLARKVPACLARRHSRRCPLRRSPISSSTFLRSLCSRPVTALPRSYGRSDSCSLRRGSARALPSGHPFGSPRAGLPDSRTRPSGHSVSNHRRVPGPPPHVLAHRSGQARVAPRRVSLIIRRLAVPRRPNRVRYPTDWPFTLLLLSTPPRGGAVAGGYRSTLDTSGEDFHLSDQVRSQAHRFFAALRMTCELTSDPADRKSNTSEGREQGKNLMLMCSRKGLTP